MEKTNLELGADLIAATVEQLEELLGEEYQTVFLGIKSQMVQSENRLRFMTGATVKNHEKIQEFGPVTNMLGSAIKGPKKIEPTEDLDPKELERKLFAEKVDRLQVGIFTSDDKSILESYKNDQNVIRGVAKRAGLPDFKDAALNAEYLGKIRQALQDQVIDEKDLKEEKDKVPAPTKPVAAPADTAINANQQK